VGCDLDRLELLQDQHARHQVAAGSHQIKGITRVRQARGLNRESSRKHDYSVHCCLAALVESPIFLETLAANTRRKRAGWGTGEASARSDRRSILLGTALTSTFLLGSLCADGGTRHDRLPCPQPSRACADLHQRRRLHHLRKHRGAQRHGLCDLPQFECARRLYRSLQQRRSHGGQCRQLRQWQLPPMRSR
jgi:hypothetical protein